MSSDLTERQAFLVLNALPNIGPITLNRLLEELGADPRNVLSEDPRRLETVRGVGPVISASIGAWREHFDFAKEEERMAQGSIDFITTRDADYPRLLKEINDPPIGLYRKGRYDFAQPNIAIIGSRRTTLYGQAMAKKFAVELARLGFCITSGLARGIDTAAHEGALSVGGKTVAVLGTAPLVPQVKSGRVKLLAVTSGTRSKAFPEVPTLAELGFKFMDISQWFGAMGPAGIPADVVTRLSSAYNKALADPKTVQRLFDAALETVGGTPEEMTKRMAAETVLWSKAARDAGLGGK